MSPHERPPLSVRWTRPDVAVLAGLLAVWAVALAVGFASSRPYLAPRDRAAETVAERIDPNTADAASLCRLPGIGATRAADIVAFRQAAAGRGRAAFRFAEDLQEVPGIGPETVRQAAPMLSLPRK